MSYILNIETATKNCSVALAKDGKLVAYQEIAEANFAHAEKLHLFITEVLTQEQLTFSDLAAVAVSKGPGSYTGLRIGVSAAKGLCYTLGIPLLAIDTLAVLAQAITPNEGTLLPMIDARRMEVFTQPYNAQHQPLQKAEALIVSEDAFQELPGALHLLGDGAPKCQELLTDPRFVFHPHLLYPSAQHMVALSEEKYKKNDIEDVAYFEPFYLKDFQFTS